MTVRIKLIGAQRFERDIASAARRLPGAMRENLAKASELIVGAAVREFVGERTRARYKLSGGRRVARKPPRPVTSPPNKLGVFEGTYRRAMSYTISGTRKNLRSEVGPVGIRYAARHEFGRRMPKRQVLTPAVVKTKEKVFALIGATFKVLG